MTENNNQKHDLTANISGKSGYILSIFKHQNITKKGNTLDHNWWIMIENDFYLVRPSHKYFLRKTDSNLNMEYAKHIFCQSLFGRKHLLPGKYNISSIIHGYVHVVQYFTLYR